MPMTIRMTPMTVSGFMVARPPGLIWTLVAMVPAGAILDTLATGDG
jgi:hypothetical protein